MGEISRINPTSRKSRIKMMGVFMGKVIKREAYGWMMLTYILYFIYLICKINGVYTEVSREKSRR